MKISGKIEFNKVPGKLPSPSCLNLFFEDISFQDVSSVLYAKKQVDVSGFDMNKTYQYSLETKKPESTKQTYSISVVLNTGWCPAENSTAWLRNDDFLSEVTVKVPLNKKENEYARDIAAVYYCKLNTRLSFLSLIQWTVPVKSSLIYWLYKLWPFSLLGHFHHH